MTLYHGMPGNELPTPASLTRNPRTYLNCVPTRGWQAKGGGKLRYGIFGDPTNTTQRFEAACEPGGILVSQSMHALLTGGHNEEAFRLAPHARIEAKGKGALPAWSLTRNL